MSSSISSSISSSSPSDASVSSQELEPVQTSAPAKEASPEVKTNSRVDQIEKVPETTPSAPTQGNPRTKRRNARKRLRARAARLAAISGERDLSIGSNQDLLSQGGVTDAAHDQEADSLEAKRKTLLEIFEPAEEEPGSCAEPHDRAVVLPAQSDVAEDSTRTSLDLEVSVQGEKNRKKIAQALPLGLEKENELNLTSQKALEESSKVAGPARRSRLDTASSKRLIFGSLGLRAPKSKQEEEDLRNSLSVKFKEPSNSLKDSILGTPTKPAEDDNNPWIDKIVLKAVECCYDGVDLSTPPFPFVQRWDPQQQGTFSGSRGKRSGGQSKRQKRNNSQYYQQYNDYDYYEEDQENPPDSQLVNPMNGIDLQSSDGTDHAALSNGNPIQSESDSIQAAVNQQILQDTDHQSIVGKLSRGVDLPRLPHDLSECRILAKSSAKPEAIIAFKQMEMSEKTNWCPIISSYRTAKIDNVLEDGTLELTLAARDVQSRVKKYDPDTGERRYEKFEMPSDNDDSADEDEGRLEISLLDMIEPKLIRSHNFSYCERNDEHEELVKGEEEDVLGRKSPQAQDANDIHAVTPTREKTELDPKGRAQTAQNLSSPARSQQGREISESARREYSLLMKDAGFRSDIPADVNEAFESTK